jgi:hypothetical protein
LELVAAPPGLATTDPSVSPLLFSPTRIGDIPELVADGARPLPHPATTPAEQALVAAA